MGTGLMRYLRMGREITIPKELLFSCHLLNLHQHAVQLGQHPPYFRGMIIERAAPSVGLRREKSENHSAVWGEGERLRGVNRRPSGRFALLRRLLALEIRSHLAAAVGLRKIRSQLVRLARRSTARRSNHRLRSQ